MDRIVKILRDLKMGIISLILTSLLLSSFVVGLEWKYPTYSGLSPIYPLLQLPLYIAISAVVLITIELIANAIGWDHNLSRDRRVIIGAICGFVVSGPLINRALTSITQEVVISDYVLWVIVFLVALGARLVYVHKRA